MKTNGKRRQLIDRLRHANWKKDLKEALTEMWFEGIMCGEERKQAAELMKWTLNQSPGK